MAARDCSRRCGPRWCEVTEPVDGETDRPTVSDDVVRAVAQHMMRRALSAIRRARHGGTLLIVPPDDAGDLAVPGVTLKYRFADQDTRRRFRHLIADDCRRRCRTRRARDGVAHVDWAFYRQREDSELRALEEAVVELAQLMASLADGGRRAW